MLYGTRKELNKKLKRMFGNEERYALLVWTKEDVMAQAWNMTEAEAHTLLELISRTGTGEHLNDFEKRLADLNRFRAMRDFMRGIPEAA